MKTSRRHLTKLAAAALAAFALGGAEARSEERHAARALRILILGGTGFIGPHQVRYALARGHKVTLFNRGHEKAVWPGPVEELLGDRDSGDLKSLHGRTWDVCIDNATRLPFWVRDMGAVLKNQVQQYIFISTVSAYAANSTPGADESAPLAVYGGANAMAETVESLKSTPQLYGPLKAVCEHEALKLFLGRTTIIRPGLIVGPGDQSDRFTYWPVRIDRGGEVLAPGDGSDPVQFIDARDLAEWTIRMAEARHFGTFNATGPAQPLTMAALLAGITHSLHARPHLTWVPAAFLDQQQVQAWSDMPVWVPGDGDDSGFARRNIDRALGAGLTFRRVSTTSIDTLAWFQQQTPERQAALKAGMAPDRESAVLAAWHSAS